MNPGGKEGSGRERELFIQALERSKPEERAAFLDGVCAGDSALRRRLQTLLEHFDQAGTFLEQPVLSGGTPRAQEAPGSREFGGLAVPVPPTEKPGDRIGRYKLLQQIGAGGWGVVYMAEQEEPIRRRVALKVIKLGMDTRQVIARFEAERQALALMDHPNIAKVFDAGATETGRPFFVMELVQGVRITEYCDQNHLPTSQRLELFMQVCQAIHHAHQKGIIHRDIKPSNILVTINQGVPVPKVIDFGIAKATGQRLTDKTAFTAFEQFIGTPAYMSPEQAAMTSLDIDTRSDIYALGVLLYELLTGRTPFDPQTLVAAGLEGMCQIIREQEPARPSTRLSSLPSEELTTTAKRRQAEAPKLIHLVQGDLDWIVMKCLEKERARRYEAASALAEDLRRHLDHHPVLAGPPGAAYRARKFVRRNRVGVAWATALLLAMSLGLAISLVGFGRARHARDRALDAETRAEQQRNRAEGALAQSQQLLWQADFEQARALRHSRMPGQRVQALAAIRAAAAIRPSPELRTEAIAALALADLEDVGPWHALPADAIRVAADGLCAQYAMATAVGVVEVRSLVDNTLKARLTNAPPGLDLLMFDRYGSRLMVKGQDRSLVCEFRTRAIILDKPALVCLAISDDGRYVVGVLDLTNTIIWDLDQRRELARVAHTPSPRRAAFSPDGARVALSRIPGTWIWRWQTSAEIPELRLPSGSIGLAWRSDGAALAIGCEDHNLYVWRPPAERPQVITGHRHEGVKPVYHPEGELLASSSHDGTLRLWDAETGMQWLESSLGAPLRFSSDGQWLATRRGQTIGRFRVHPPDTCRMLSPGLGSSNVVHRLAFSPDSRFLAGIQPEQFVVWDLASRRLLWSQALPGANWVQFLDSRRLLAAGARGVQLWTNAGPPSSWQLAAPTAVVQPRGVVRDCDLSRDRRRLLLTVGQAGAVYDLPPTSPLTPAEGSVGADQTSPGATNRPLVEPHVRLLGQPMFHSAALSPDGQWAASGYWDNGLRRGGVAMWLWSAADGRPVRQIPLGNCAPCFSPDGRWFLATSDWECRLYAVAGAPDQWREVWRRPLESRGPPYQGAAFSRDASRLALLIDQTGIQLVATATGRDLACLRPPDPWIWALAWSPDGRWLAGSSKSGTFVWDLPLLHTRLRELGLDWD